MFVTAVKGGRPALKIIVQPKAKKTAILGLHDNMVKLAVASPPVDGKANREVIRCLADLFGLKKSEVTIVTGRRSRKKICVLGELKEESIRKILLAHLR